MSNYALYFSPDSANVVVRAALETAGVAYDAHLVDRGAQMQRSPEYLALNPQGLLPVLTDGDEVIFETAAILLHLVDREAGLGPKVRESGRSDLYRWLFYLSNTVHADLRVVFYTPRYIATESNVPDLRAGIRERFFGHLELIDNELGKHDGDFLLASGFSVCDLYLAFCSRWFLLYPHDEPKADVARVQRMSNLWRYVLMMEEHAGVVSACEAEEIGAPFITSPSMPNPTSGSVLG